MRTTQLIGINTTDILTLHQYLIDKRIIVDKLFDKIKKRTKEFNTYTNLNPNEIANLEDLNLHIETIQKAISANMPPITLAEALKLRSEIYRKNDDLINEIESLENNNKVNYSFYFCPTADSPKYTKNIAYTSFVLLVVGVILSATLIGAATYLYSLSSEKHPSANKDAPSGLGVGIGILALTILISAGMKKLIKQIEDCKNRPLHTIRNNLTLFANTEASDDSLSTNEKELQEVVVHL